MEVPTLASKSKPRSGTRFDLLFPILYGLVFAALGFFIQMRWFPIGDTDLETDFYADLVIAARHLIEGHFTVHDFAYKGPLYSFVLVLARGIAGDWYRGAILLSALSGGVYLALAYRLVRRLFDRRVAIATTIAASLVVEFCVHLHRATTDVLFLCLSLAAMSCTLLAGKSQRQQALAGAMAALAFLTRYNGIALVGGAALVLAVANPDGLGWRQRLKSFGVYLGTFLLVCAPWFIANWMETGRVLATRNVETIVMTFYNGPRWQDDPTTEIRSMTALFATHPAHFVARFARNLVEHATKDVTLLLRWPLALVPLLGLLGFAIVPPTRRQLGLYLFAAAYWLFMGIVFYSPRFSLPLVVPYLAAGFALARAGSTESTRLGRSVRRWLQTRSPRLAAWSVLCVLLLGLAVVQVRRIVAVERTIHERRPLYILSAAQALREREPKSGVMARKGHIAYYAGRDFTLYPRNAGPIEELVRFARSQGVEYLVYSQVEYSMLPHMLYFAVTDSVPLLHEIYRAPSIRIFRIAADRGTPLTNAQRHELLLASLRAARSQGRPEAICLACEDLGLHHLRQREFDAAAVAFQDALDVAQAANGGPEMELATTDARHNLALTGMESGRPESAIPLLEQNLAYFTAHGSPSNIARTHATLGHAYELLGRTEEAQRERRMARELNPRGGEPPGADSLRAGQTPE